jgi:hypothetical protein
MLKLIDEPPREEDEIFQEIIKLLPDFDGFLLVGVKNNKIYPIKYHVSIEEIVYMAEYVKSKIFIEGDIN